MVMTLGTFTAVAQVQSLVGELRSCKPHGAAKKKKAAADGGGLIGKSPREEGLKMLESNCHVFRGYPC